ncbi:phosphoglucosamine mutase [Photobacterium rosenbergii]|uniref:Phosphoglucosamine mutase n=1 Tax=Photobacterium rosenbergii TaxID=294936 RepID=A0A2T3NBG8_9GAMM|nr:phosphoglucosamine mutase [Photobacterium rosenbergii]PSW11208.1 phosphoglucosamine mutase [Photobacterium rosenbergii]
MTRKYFGTDGVRGKVGEYPITPDFALKLGWAAGRVLSRLGTKKVIIGKDTRISGYMLESALEAGLSAAGINAILTGPIPTPAVAYLTKTFRAEAGIVISASHNPYYDNGIKFFSESGEKLPDEVEFAIEAELDKDIQCVSSDLLGKAKRMDDAAGRYIEFCKGTFPSSLSLAGMKLVVDCANGAAYHIAPAVFSELGAEVIAIGDKPNGLNINEKCGATSMGMLQEAVVEHKADMGIALDGDSDRIMMVDSQGNVIDGDQILFVLAKQALIDGQLKGGVVGTLMSNMGLEVALGKLGIPFVRANVGDRYVMEQLLERNWWLGGENSGHVICRNLVTTGDAIVAALQVLAVVSRSGKSLDTLVADMPMMPQILINVRFGGENQPLESELVKAAVVDAEKAMEVGTDTPKGRILLRKSGTEPLIRVMAEAETAEMAQQWAEHIAEAVKAA